MGYFENVKFNPSSHIAVLQINSNIFPKASPRSSYIVSPLQESRQKWWRISYPYMRAVFPVQTESLFDEIM